MALLASPKVKSLMFMVVAAVQFSLQLMLFGWNKSDLREETPANPNTIDLQYHRKGHWQQDSFSTNIQPWETPFTRFHLRKATSKTKINKSLFWVCVSRWARWLTSGSGRAEGNCTQISCSQSAAASPRGGTDTISACQTTIQFFLSAWAVCVAG